MIINLFEVFEFGRLLRFNDYSLSLSGKTFARDDVKSFDVKASGIVKKIANAVRLEMKVDLSFDCLCDNCAESVSKEIHFEFEHPIIEYDKENDDINCIKVNNYNLDLDSVIIEDVLLEFPSKVLCKDGCLGLCQKCGKNLNYGYCNCAGKVVDPRLSVLEDLLG